MRKTHSAFVGLTLALFPSITTLAAEATRKSDKASDLKAPSAQTNPADKPAAARNEAERVNVENIKEKYWARGDESELGVVQNRAYSKARKFELGVFTGTMVNDPFLNVKGLGGIVGYHFNEYFSLQFMGWKSYVTGSGAYEAFQQGIQESEGVAAVPSTNDPHFYYGGEAVGSILYGKLSVLGAAIIYYDMHIMGGLGLTATDTGRNFTQHIGIGQQIYLSKSVALRLDYRLMHYSELLVRKSSAADQAASPTEGQAIGDRANWTNAITLGLDILFDFGSFGGGPK